MYLIDVRSPDELKESGGPLPDSINIPLAELANALAMEDDAFKKKYGRSKPKTNDKIMINCGLEKQGEDAVAQVMALGFTNVTFYNCNQKDCANKECHS